MENEALVVVYYGCRVVDFLFFFVYSCSFGGGAVFFQCVVGFGLVVAVGG